MKTSCKGSHSFCANYNRRRSIGRSVLIHLNANHLEIEGGSYTLCEGFRTRRELYVYLAVKMQDGTSTCHDMAAVENKILR